MRGQRAARLLYGAALAWFLGTGPAAALETTLAGRPLEVSGHGELHQVFEVDENTEGECPFLQLLLRTRYSIADGLSFESAVSGLYGGPATESTGAGIYTFDQVFQSRSPSLEFEEAFVDWRTESVDVRVGKQKFAWGKLDRFQAVDVLNTERYSDFLLEEDERKIGVPAVQVAYSLPERFAPSEESRLTLVWIPQYLPFRFPRQGERWFPPAAVPPRFFTVPDEVVHPPNGTGSDDLEVPVDSSTVNSDAPAFHPRNSGYGARFSGFAAGLDYSFYYYHGFDSQPAFRLDAEATAVLLSPPPGENQLPFTVTAATELRPAFRRIDLFGADAAWVWGPFAARAEAAYVRGRPFSRDLRSLIRHPEDLATEVLADLQACLTPTNPFCTVPIDLPSSFVERDAIEWGIGVDYDLAGYLLLLQVNQTDVLDNGVDLLIEDVETRLLANLRKTFLNDDLTAQLIAQQAIESEYTVLLPRLTYQMWRGLQVRLGYLFIAGRKSSVVGQYRRNDEAFVRLRYLF